MPNPRQKFSLGKNFFLSGKKNPRQIPDKIKNPKTNPEQSQKIRDKS